MKIAPIVLNVVLLLAICTDAHSQTDLQAESRFGLSAMLRYKGVRQDLKMSDQQYEKLLGLWSEVEHKLTIEFRAFKKGYSERFSEEKKKALQGELMIGITQVREFESERLEAVLNSQQIKRLEQIRFQVLQREQQGAGQLIEALELSSRQLTQFEKFQEECKTRLSEFQQNARRKQLTENEMAEELQSLRKEFEEEMLEILTVSQRNKLKDLQGKPFEFQVGKPKQKSDKDDGK